VTDLAGESRLVRGYIGPQVLHEFGVRYLVDPLLPKSIELVVGAVFYLALLGLINCWLLWWSESLVPGLLSALVFFAAYRTLGSG